MYIHFQPIPHQVLETMVSELDWVNPNPTFEKKNPDPEPTFVRKKLIRIQIRPYVKKRVRFYKILPNKIILTLSFDIKVNVIGLLILLYCTFNQ